MEEKNYTKSKEKSNAIVGIRVMSKEREKDSKHVVEYIQCINQHRLLSRYDEVQM